MEDNMPDKISPKKAKQILLNDGIDVTIEEAKTILDFLYLMSEIVVDQYLNNTEYL